MNQYHSYFENENFHYDCLGKSKFFSTTLSVGTLGHKLEEDAKDYLASIKHSGECIELNGDEKEQAIKQAMKNLEIKENRNRIRGIKR